MYKLSFEKNFLKASKKLSNKKRLKLKQLNIVLERLRENPFSQSLKTHRVDSKNHGKAWSSRVDGDLRIIWNFDSEDRVIILLLDIGGHSGTDKVYKSWE